MGNLCSKEKWASTRYPGYGDRDHYISVHYQTRLLFPSSDRADKLHLKLSQHMLYIIPAFWQNEVDQ